MLALCSSALLAEINANTIFLVGLLLVVGFMLRNARKRRSGTKLPPVSEWGKAVEPAARDPRRALPDDVARWEVRMHDLARDLTGQLDSKIAILQILLRDAHQQIARLESATAPGRSARRSPAANVAAEPANKIDPRCSEIYRLADDGYSSAAISYETGTPVGEVDLILSVRSASRA